MNSSSYGARSVFFALRASAASAATLPAMRAHTPPVYRPPPEDGFTCPAASPTSRAPSAIVSRTRETGISPCTRSTSLPSFCSSKKFERSRSVFVPSGAASPTRTFPSCEGIAQAKNVGAIDLPKWMSTSSSLRGFPSTVAWLAISISSGEGRENEEATTLAGPSAPIITPVRSSSSAPPSMRVIDPG